MRPSDVIPRAPTGSPAASEASAVYTGALSGTARRTVHVTDGLGHAVPIEVYSVVNLATDPNLRGAILDGTLHRLPGRDALAMAYVLHDPAARKFALVLPAELRHRELVERASLLERLAADVNAVLPDYVRQATVVVGPDRIAAFLAQSDLSVPLPTASDALLREVERARNSISAREETVDILRSDLAERETDLFRREQDLAMRIEELNQAFADLLVREQALDERLSLLQERELALSTASAVEEEVEDGELDAVEDVAAGDVDEADSLPEEPAPFPPSFVPDFDELVETAPAESPSPDLPPLDEPAERAGDYPAEVNTGEFLALPASEEESADGEMEVASAETFPAEEEMVNEDDVSSDDEFDEAAEEVTFAIEDVNPDAPSGPTTIAPPDSFTRNRATEMSAAAHEGAVVLFVRLTEGKEDVFDDPSKPVDLLVQWMEVQGCPVAVLALVQRGERRPYVRREVLDPREPTHRRVLEILSKRYEAQAMVFMLDGRHVRTLDIRARREGNVRRLLAKVDQVPAHGDRERAAALERALAAPPPAGGSGHPFVDPAVVPSASELFRSLPLLEKWSSNEQKDRAVLVLSVPEPDVDEVFRSRLTQAVARGLALPAGLEREAVERGLVEDPTGLIRRAIATFSASGEALGKAEAADNWERLLERAADLGIEVADDVLAQAWEVIRTVRAPRDVQPLLEAVTADGLPELSTRALAVLLHHPRLRADAIVALSGRKEDVDVGAVCAAVARVPEADAVRVVRGVLAFGERAGDGLIELLESDKSYVRLLAVLGLGELKLRRSIVPLVERLQVEETNSWREIARVLSTFGASAFRSLSRLFRDPKGNETRFAYALAHFANHGSESDVQKLASSDDPTVYAMAKEGLARRDEAKRDEAEVSGQGETDPNATERVFSARFSRTRVAPQGNP